MCVHNEGERQESRVPVPPGIKHFKGHPVCQVFTISHSKPWIIMTCRQSLLKRAFAAWQLWFMLWIRPLHHSTGLLIFNADIFLFTFLFNLMIWLVFKTIYRCLSLISTQQHMLDSVRKRIIYHLPFPTNKSISYLKT